MKERPILFSAPMVRALLAGTKTQTRRRLKRRPGQEIEHSALFTARDPFMMATSPYGVPGDRLWVKETIHATPALHGDRAIFAADGALTKLDSWPWKRSVLSSIHCPRGLSRLTLEVTDVRVQRLQDISEEDARAEGFSSDPVAGSLNGKPAQIAFFDPRQWYVALWDGINGAGSWKTNPWVWAITFRRLP